MAVATATSERVHRRPTVTWDEIQREATKARDSASDPDGYGYKYLRKPAEELAKRSDRATINAVFEATCRRDAQVRVTADWVVSAMLGAYLTIEVVERDTDCHLKAMYQRHDPDVMRTAEVAIAAIDCYHDEEAKAWLLETALHNEHTKGWAFEYALPLLRGYKLDAAERKMLEDTLQEQILQGNSAGRRFITGVNVADHLHATIASLRFASKLPAAEQLRYRDFESRLWRARAIAPTGFRGIHMEYVEAAYLADGQWKSEDETYLWRILESTASTPQELEIAVNLCHRLKDADRLALIAEGEGPNSEFARRGLKHHKWHKHRRSEFFPTPSSENRE